MKVLQIRISVFLILVTTVVEEITARADPVCLVTSKACWTDCNSSGSPTDAGYIQCVATCNEFYCTFPVLRYPLLIASKTHWHVDEHQVDANAQPVCNVLTNNCVRNCRKQTAPESGESNETYDQCLNACAEFVCNYPLFNQADDLPPSAG